MVINTMQERCLVPGNEQSIVWDMPSNQKIIYVETIPELKNRPVYSLAKRVADILISLFSLLVLLVPMIIISVIIILDSPGCPVYSQVRLGLDGKPFKILKFRSMIKNAEADGLRWTEVDDPRVTRFGKILRRTRLDELPQLINILLGQMSFVGPRPERPEFYELFDTYIIGFRQRLMVMPGLTGWAQVQGGYDLRPEEKIQYDIEYMKQRSLWMDIICLLKTFHVVITGKGTR